MSDVAPPVTADRQPVTVFQGELPCPGVRSGRVAAYEYDIRETLAVRPGLSRRQRAYLLLDESVQLAQPLVFPSHQAGWWYVDLVAIDETDTTITVADRYIDVIVGPPGHPYRMLDLDEFGEALQIGAISADEGARVLAATQAFLDRHLNRRHDLEVVWPDFPPTVLASVQHTAIPPRPW
jgi:hypothetical protein